jgi:hypothetical protein
LALLYESNKRNSMFDTSDISAFRGVVGWRQHFNADVVVTGPQLTTSSGRYFQDFHPALRLDMMRAALDKGQDINDYMDEVVDTGIKQVLSMIRSERLDKEGGKDILVNDLIYSKYGGTSDAILNEGYFVGFCIEMKSEIGLMARLLSVGLHTKAVESLNLYVFHSSKKAPIATIAVTSTAYNVTWTDSSLKMHSENEYVGGEYYIGYYQDDLTDKAINYKAFDWQKGPCEGCDGGIARNKWRNLNRHLGSISSFYVPSPTVGELWEPEDIVWVNNMTWGLNLKLSVECNLNQFVEEHKHLLDEAIGLSVAERVLSMYKFSQTINSFEENLKMMAIRDYEGDKETNMLNINQRLMKAIKALNFDFSKLSAPCLACAAKGRGIRKGQA